MKRRRIICGALLAAVLGGLAWAVLRPREPVYQGKRLGYWLETYLERNERGFVRWSKSDAAADEALHHMGTNAVPWLLRLLRAEDSALKRRLMKMTEDQYYVDNPFTPDWGKQLEAVAAFEALGATASNSVPALLQICRENRSSQQQSACFLVFGAIGPPAADAVPVLLDSLTNSKRMEPHFIELQSLGKIHPPAETVLPALMMALERTTNMMRDEAVTVLASYGSEARPAVPLLLPLLKAPGPNTRTNAAFALKAIDPAAAAKAGVK